MCDDCNHKVSEMRRSPAALECDWRCLVCGDQRFKKEADPEGVAVPYGINWSEILFYLFVTITLVAWIVGYYFGK